MLNDYVLEKFFIHTEVQEVSIGEQTRIIRIFDEIVKQIEEEKPYATLSELLSATDIS